MFPGPVVPYIREADFAIRTPWYPPPRRLLDYLLLSVQEGECQVVVEGEELLLGSDDFCLIQSNTLHSLRGLTEETVCPDPLDGDHGEGIILTAARSGATRKHLFTVLCGESVTTEHPDAGTGKAQSATTTSSSEPASGAGRLSRNSRIAGAPNRATARNCVPCRSRGLQGPEGHQDRGPRHN